MKLVSGCHQHFPSCPWPRRPAATTHSLSTVLQPRGNGLEDAISIDPGQPEIKHVPAQEVGWKGSGYELNRLDVFKTASTKYLGFLIGESSRRAQEHVGMWPLQWHLIHPADAFLHEEPPVKRSAASWDSQARFLPLQPTAFYAAVGKKSSLQVSSSVVSRRGMAIACSFPSRQLQRRGN